MYNIVFVCHGNICRSPMAEFIFKSMLKERHLENSFHVESAAVSDEEYGNSIYPEAKRCLTRHNIPFSLSKTARTITKKDYDTFDIIICMDKSNIRLLNAIIGKDVDNKVFLLMTFTGKDKDVADPWFTRDFETTWNDLQKGCNALLNYILKQHNK